MIKHLGNIRSQSWWFHLCWGIWAPLNSGDWANRGLGCAMVWHQNTELSTITRFFYNCFLKYALHLGFWIKHRDAIKIQCFPYLEDGRFQKGWCCWERYFLYLSPYNYVCVHEYMGTDTHIYMHTPHPHVCEYFHPLYPTLGCFAGANTHIWDDLCPLLPLGVWPGFITFHVLVGYGGILVTNQNCKKSCFIFMTLFLPPPTLSSQFYIQEQKLTLIYLQFMIQGPEAEQTLVLCNAQIFSNGAHTCLEQLLQGFSEFHHIFSQDVPLQKQKQRVSFWGQNFCLGHSRDLAAVFLLTFCSGALWLYAKEGLKTGKVEILAVCIFHFQSFPSFHVPVLSQPQFGRSFCW